MKKRIVIIGNGSLYKKILQEILEDDYVIGVDRAAYWLIQQGRIPDVAIGDFDSCKKEEFNTIQQSVKNIQYFPPEKDQTDMELAVHDAIKLKPSEVLIFGGIGSRMDHTIATMQILDQLMTAKIPHSLVNETNHVQVVGRGRTILSTRGEYKYISIIPFTKKISLKLSGFRYDLPKTTITEGSSYGVSNEICSKEAEITLFSGKAWIVESKD